MEIREYSDEELLSDGRRIDQRTLATKREKRKREYDQIASKVATRKELQRLYDSLDE